MSKIDRRAFLMGSALACVPAIAAAADDPYAASPWRKLSDADWRKRLDTATYNVLRKEATEMAGTSPLNKGRRRGTYVCAGCALPLFSSATKFDSRTGWPSFWQPLDDAVGTRKDRALGMVRTEVHCRRCGGHLGHVFDDGPAPTGLRYCMNGLSLTFLPRTA